MIQVINRLNRIKTIKCSHYGCEFSYHIEKDVKTFTNSKAIDYVICPKCKKVIDMKLKALLGLIQDEEAKLTLEIDIEGKEEYQYVSFWLSDYRSNHGKSILYKDCIVEGISFISSESGSTSELLISIKQ